MERRLDGNYVRTRPPWDGIARDVAHRPWPPPERPWIVAQSWRDLLFAHWPVSPALLRPFLPPVLELDTFAGDAWIGVVPFRISHIAPRGMSQVLGLAFPELNVRTYVTASGKPGVWFFSLDAASLLAVTAARLAFHLPYFWARMSMGDDDGWIAYTSRRRHPGAPRAEFIGRYRPAGAVFQSAPGSLEDWLTARYCLYAANRSGAIFRTEIHHAPWPLQVAAAEMTVNTMVQGITLPGSPLLHFARSLDVVTWLPYRVAGRES
jgi:uncharacterized protein YqjF (DUF2071 family)